MLRLLIKALISLVTKPEFRKLATSLDYLQLTSYSNRDDLLITLGHIPKEEQEQQQGEEQEQEQPNISLKFLLEVYKMAPEGILQPFDGGTSLTFLVDKSSKEKIKEVLK